MSSFGTFGIFLLLADSGEMGPDCRLLSGYFLVFVGITDPFSQQSNVVQVTQSQHSLHHFVLESLWGCSKEDLTIQPLSEMSVSPTVTHLVPY